jgi:hypothetical protein
LCLFLSGICSAQTKLQFDLSKIAFVVNGRQVCESKGRMQDYPSAVMGQIIAAGPKAVPVLIAMLPDTRIAKTEVPVICYWPGMTIGDIAFCVLQDLFMDPDANKATVSAAGWNEMLGPDEGRPAWEQLHHFARKRGRGALQAKWQNLWDKYASQVSWDAKDKCFKLKASK